MTTVNYAGSTSTYNPPPLKTYGITTVNFDTPPLSGPSIAKSAEIDTSPGSLTAINANSDVLGTTTLNLGAGSITTVNGTLSGYTVDVNGGPGSMLINNGTIDSAWVNINATVLGHGTMEFTHWGDSAGKHEVGGYSGSGLTYDLSGNMTIDAPHSFLSKVNFIDVWPEQNIDLVGLSATSYDLKNDLLTLYQGNAAIYQLRLSVSPSPGSGFVVQDYSASAFVPRGGVSLTYDYGKYLTGLPQHTATT